MDIQLEKKRGIQKKHLPYVGGGVLFLALVGWIIFGDHASTLKVDARGISIGEVTKEQFNDFVRVNGQVQPITVVQLSPEEGGIVQEKVVEEGAQVATLLSAFPIQVSICRYWMPKLSWRKNKTSCVTHRWPWNRTN